MQFIFKTLKAKLLFIFCLAMSLYNMTLGGTTNSFGVMYVGLIDLFRAGEFQTSLVSVTYSVCSCLGCKSFLKKKKLIVNTHIILCSRNLIKMISNIDLNLDLLAISFRTLCDASKTEVFT